MVVGKKLGAAMAVAIRIDARAIHGIVDVCRHGAAAAVIVLQHNDVEDVLVAASCVV
jgi:hypothetical protein